MNEGKGKLHTLKDVLLSPRTDYQGKLRYLVPLFYILIGFLVNCVIIYVWMYMSRQVLQYVGFIVILIWLLWGLAIMMYKRQKEGRKV